MPCPTCGAPKYRYGSNFLKRLHRINLRANLPRVVWCFDCLAYAKLGKLPLRYVQPIWPLKKRQSMLKRRRIWLKSGAVTIWQPTKMQKLRVEQAKKRFKKQLIKERKKVIRGIEKKKRRKARREARAARANL